jgi:hypothetical protein
MIRKSGNRFCLGPTRRVCPEIILKKISDAPDSAKLDQTLAATVRMAMDVESMRRTTEAAVSNRAILRPPSIRIGPLVRTAIITPHETH